MHSLFARNKIIQWMNCVGRVQGRGMECINACTVCREQPAVLEELCKKGANKNAQNKAGLTALHTAVDQDLAECVRVLVSNGANVNVQVGVTISKCKCVLS